MEGQQASAAVLPLGGKTESFVRNGACLFVTPWCELACPGYGCTHRFKTVTSLLSHTQGVNARTRQRPACINYVLDYGCFFNPVFLDRFVALVSREEGKANDTVNRNAGQMFQYITCPNDKDFDLSTALGYLSQAAESLSAIVTEVWIRYNHLPYWHVRRVKPMERMHPAALEKDSMDPSVDPDTLVKSPTHYFHVRAARLGVSITKPLLAMPYWLVDMYLSLVQWSNENNGTALDYDFFGGAVKKQLQVLQVLKVKPDDLPAEYNFQIAEKPSAVEKRCCASYEAGVVHCKSTASQDGFIVEPTYIECKKCNQPMHGLCCAYEVPFMYDQLCYGCYSNIIQKISMASAALAQSKTNTIETTSLIPEPVGDLNNSSASTALTDNEMEAVSQLVTAHRQVPSVSKPSANETANKTSEVTVEVTEVTTDAHRASSANEASSARRPSTNEVADFRRSSRAKKPRKLD
jgi:hypothetical protein